MDEKYKVYVGNLPYRATEEEIRNFFEQAGVQVKEVMIIMDKATGRSKGFGFVEVDSEEAINTAIEALNGKEMGGRQMKISKANKPAPRP